MYIMRHLLHVAAATEETDGQGDAENPKHQAEGGTENREAYTDPGDKTEAAESEEGDTKHGTKSSNEDQVPEDTDVQSDSNSQSTTERRSSYELAAEEDTQLKHVEEDEEIPAIKMVEEPAPTLPQDNKQRKKAGGGGKRISRSTSSPSAGARIRLQESMGIRSIPGVGSAHSPLLLRSSVSTSRSGLSASFPSPGQKNDSEEKPGTSRMAKLLESEAQTGSYNCPLVGCVPASALKYFAEKEERKQLHSTSPQSSTSPSLVYEPSGMCMQPELTCIHDGIFNNGIQSILAFEFSIKNMPRILAVLYSNDDHSLLPVHLSVTSLTSLTETAPSPQPDTDSTVPIPIPVSQQNGTAEEHSSSTKQESQVSITVTSTGDEFEEEAPESPSLEEKPSPNSRLRARSLPPQLIYSPSPPPSPEKEENEREEESSLDRSPSHLRRSPGFRTPEPPEPTVSRLSKRHAYTHTHAHTHTHMLQLMSCN